MFGITFQEVGQVKLSVLPDPGILAAGDAIVQVEMAGLCGSDLHPFWGREKGLDPGTVMGHEFVGRIVEVGSQVLSLSVGDQVFAPFSSNCGVCFFCTQGLPSRCPEGQLFGWRSEGRGLHGGQAQFVRVPLADGTLVKVPPNMSHEMALLLGDNLSTGYYCTDLADVRPDGSYAVVGCGNVGLMAILAARMKNCSQIVAIDPVAERRALAEQLGAHAVETAHQAQQVIAQWTDGRGADGVMELVGMPVAQRMAFDLARPGAVIATVGCHCDQSFAFSPVEAYDKNLTYRTGRCPARYYMSHLLDKPEVHALDPRPFVTHVFEVSDGPLAYDLFSKRQDGIIKGVFDLR